MKITVCDHCAEPVPRRLSERGERYCCAGCATVAAALSELGLEDFYLIAERFGARPERPVEGTRGDWVHDEELRESCLRELDDGRFEARLRIEGMSCAACVWLIERLPRVLQGLDDSRVNLTRQQGVLRFDPRQTDLETLVREIGRVGYRALPPGAPREAADRDQMRRLIVAGASAGNTMLIAFALYGGVLHGMGESASVLLRWASLLVAAPAVLYSAVPFYRRSLAGLRARRAHIDLPIAVAVLTAFLASTVNVIRGSGELWLDSATALIFLLLAGRTLNDHQRRKAFDRTDLLATFLPDSARLLDAEGAERQVSARSLVSGDRLRIAAGATIPADGTIVSGRGLIDRSLLTGESLPQAIRAGNTVIGGTALLDGQLELVVDKPWNESRLARLLERILESRPARFVDLGDRLARYFVAATFAAAALAFWLAWPLGLEAAIERSIAVLVVTCPCALALATPLSYAAAMATAAGRRILVSSGEVLELLVDPGLLVFDKTGTLTAAVPEVSSLDGDPAGLELAAGLEHASVHPLAAAIRAAVSMPVELASEIEEVSGVGVFGRFADRRVAVGRPEDISSELGELAAGIDELRSAGSTAVGVSVDDELITVLGISNPVAAGSRQLLDHLREKGWQTLLASGDEPKIVHQVGRALGFACDDRRGGLGPEAKHELIRVASDAHATTVMIGDGANDAPALAEATVGIALRGGAEAAAKAADVVLLSGRLEQLDELFQLALETRRTLKAILAFSLAYNILGGGLAIAGLVHPMIAAILMPASSLSVIVLAAGLARWKPQPMEASTKVVHTENMDYSATG